jgi:very-short-patch-repair endonuclease
MTTGAVESPFEEQVHEVLENLGFTAHCQVGDSGFRIDLAVLAKDPSLGYILGIECDGAAYHSDRSARLRDVWRAQILRRRGWRLHRIWSTRWWYHRGEEIEALKIALEQAQAQFER